MELIDAFEKTIARTLPNIVLPMFTHRQAAEHLMQEFVAPLLKQAFFDGQQIGGPPSERRAQAYATTITNIIPSPPHSPS